MRVLTGRRRRVPRRDDIANNVETIRRGVETLDRGGIDAWIDFLREVAHPDVEFAPIVLPGADGAPLVVGVEAGCEYYRDLHALIGDFRLIDPVIDAVGDDVVLVEGDFTSSGAAAPGTARRLYFVYEFRDGLVFRAYAYTERKYAKRHADEAAGNA